MWSSFRAKLLYATNTTTNGRRRKRRRGRCAKLESGGHRVQTWIVVWIVIAHVIASYRTKWFIKIVGPNKHKEVDPGTLFMSMDSRWDSFNYKSSHMYVRSGLTGLCSLCSLKRNPSFGWWWTRRFVIYCFGFSLIFKLTWDEFSQYSHNHTICIHF